MEHDRDRNTSNAARGLGKLVLGATLSVVCMFGLDARADWPQFRGPGHDGISDETGLMTEWPEQGPPVRWRSPLGDGYSALAVKDGRIYTLAGRGKNEFAFCFDAADGREVWRVRVGANWKDNFGKGPRVTPTVGDGVVYVLGARGSLVALGAEDGKTIWSRDLAEEYDADVPRWGMAASPLLHGGRLYVQVGGRQALFAAFEPKTGREIWKSGSGKSGYATPLPVSIGGVEQILFFAGEALYSVDPRSGRTYWKVPWKTSYDVNAAMPVFVEPDRLFVSSGYDTGAAMFRVRAGESGVTAEEIWRTRDMKNQFSSSILRGDHIYGFDNKILKCIDARTGETVWKARDFGHGSLMYADGHLIVMGDGGQLALVEATPEAYREAARARVFDGKTWTVPTLSGGILYVRDENELVALAVAE